MTPDHPDANPENADELGVLSDAASTDTSVLGILGGATAQVRVTLPMSGDDDLLDDDVIGDEVDFTAEAEPELVLDAAAVDDDEATDASDDADAEVTDASPGAELEAGDWSTVDLEGRDVAADADPGEVVAEAELEADDAGLETDDAGADVEADAGTEADATDAGSEDDEAEGEAPGATRLQAVPERIDEPVETEPVEAAEIEPEPAVTRDGADDAVLEDEELEDDPTLAAPASRDDEMIEDAEIVAPDLDASVDDMIESVSDDDVRHVPQEASMDETRAQRAHEVERVRVRKPDVTLSSKRLDDFEAGKESSDLLTPDRLLEPGKLTGGEPEGAWQHLVYSLSGGRINLGDGKRARARKDLTNRIAAPLSGGARFVPVLSRKGGVGKTTITTLLGMALADARDDRVIAIDANPDRGTLAERIARPSGKTVRDLVRMKGNVKGYNDVSTVVARDETRLDVLASDADPHVSEAFSDKDYEDVAALAAHYYSIVLTDTGTGIVHSVMEATLGLADQLVIVSGLSIDEARLASETLTWLESNGYAAQVRNAVVVLNNARPGAPLVREDELEAHFGSRVRAVVRVPYDPAIATGSAIAFRELQPATREAARELAVTVVEGLRALPAAA